MSLLNQIKADQLEARKVKATTMAELLTTLIGEASMIGKNDGNRETTDAEVVAIVKKFIKNIEEFLAANVDEARKVVLHFELDILSKYLPKQLTQDQIEAEVQVCIFGGAKNLGVIMSHFKNKFAGMYDGKVVSEVAKAML